MVQTLTTESPDAESLSQCCFSLSMYSYWEGSHHWSPASAKKKKKSQSVFFGYYHTMKCVCENTARTLLALAAFWLLLNLCSSR